MRQKIRDISTTVQRIFLLAIIEDTLIRKSRYLPRTGSASPLPMIVLLASLRPAGSRLRYLLPRTKVPLPLSRLRARVNSGTPCQMPVKRILRRFSRLRGSDAMRIKEIFSPPRQHPRALLDTDVRVEGHDFTFTARSVQLGTQGVSLSEAGQLSLAQPVLLRFNLPSGRSVKIGAVVWWKTTDLVGLRFDPRENNRHIEEWIRSRAVLSSTPI